MKMVRLVLELDADTAAALKKLEVECSVKGKQVGFFSFNLPVIIPIANLDWTRFVGPAKRLLGDEAVDRLILADWRFKIMIVSGSARPHVKVRESR